MILPAPVGEPQTINLPDGSMLVPIARVDASGNRTPLAGGAGSAPLTGGGGGASDGGVVHAAEGTAVTASGDVQAAGRKFEPHALMYNDNYYKKYIDGDTNTNFGRFNIEDREQVEERAIESTLMYLKDKEPDVDDFGITGVNVRRVNQGADRDLLNVNPDAHWIVTVHGTQGDGTARKIPTVMNADGTTYTDPPLRRG
jgi:hypothetical protein